MRNFLFILSLITILGSCGSGDNSSYTPSSSYSQPTTRIVNCSYCSGSGIILNPYDGNYYYCQNCRGTGKITITNRSSNPSFTGMTNCNKCECPGWPAGRSKNLKCGRNLGGGRTCNHTYKEHGL